MFYEAACLGLFSVLFGLALSVLITVLPKDQQISWLPWTFGINHQLTGNLFFSLEYHRNAMDSKEPEQYASNTMQPIYTRFPVTLMGQDYLMSLLQYQLRPIWSFSFSSMHNGNDGSSLILPNWTGKWRRTGG